MYVQFVVILIQYKLKIMNPLEFLKTKGIDPKDVVIYNMNNPTNPRIDIIKWFTEFSNLTPDNEIMKKSVEYGTTQMNGFKPWKQLNKEKIQSFRDGANWINDKIKLI